MNQNCAAANPADLPARHHQSSLQSPASTSPTNQQSKPQASPTLVTPGMCTANTRAVQRGDSPRFHAHGHIRHGIDLAAQTPKPCIQTAAGKRTG